MTHVRIGNAGRDGTPFRGWFVGHFMPPGLPHSGDIEIKWGEHTLHEERKRWARSEHATTMSMVIKGSIRLYFDEAEHLLSQPGDYALWGPGIKHRWRIESNDTIILTVRWPSLPGDATDL